MVVAFFTAAIAVFFAYLSGFDKNHCYKLIFAFIILTAFLSLGYYWGNDVERYEERFIYYTSSGISLLDFNDYDYVARGEFGYVLINLLCEPIGFWGMRALLFVVENAIVFYFIVKHVDRKWYWLAVFVYVFNPNFWVLSSSMMRQWLAMCICLLGTDFLSRRKIIWYIALTLLASTIHQTSLVCFLLLPIFFISKKASTNSSVIFIFFWLVFFAVSWFFRDFIIMWIMKEDYYTVYDEVTTNVGITSIGRVIIFILLLYLAIKQQTKDSFFNWTVLLYAITLPLLSYSQLVSRIGLYFTIGTIAVYPSFCSEVKVKKIYKQSLILVVCSYLLYMFYIFFNSPTYHSSFYNYRILPFF